MQLVKAAFLKCLEIEEKNFKVKLNNFKCFILVIFMHFCVWIQLQSLFALFLIKLYTFGSIIIDVAYLSLKLLYRDTFKNVNLKIILTTSSL